MRSMTRACCTSSICRPTPTTTQPAFRLRHVLISSHFSSPYSSSASPSTTTGTSTSTTASASERKSRKRNKGDGDGIPYPDPPGPGGHHADLGTFLAYAERTGLDPASTVYVGTHYEYTVARSLSRYGLTLRRVGGASDLGTDLVGVWDLPAPKRARGRPSVAATAAGTAMATGAKSVRVLVQCKAGASQAGPQHVRELEGAFAGAPPGWRARDGVMGLLVGTRTATKGVREALGRSGLPMGYVCCRAGEGTVSQMLWNARAEEEGLEGWGAVVRHRVDSEGDGGGGSGEGELVLVRNGKVVGLLEPKG